MAAGAAALTATAQIAEATVVLDLGSLTTKAGFAASIPSDDEPRVVTPSRVHVLPTALAATAAANGVSADAGLPRGQLARYPLRDAFAGGRLADADALESVLHYVLYELVGWQPGREGPLVLVEPGAGLPRRDREALVRLLFESFSVTHLYSVDALAASAYAHGRLTGTVLDLGHGRADVGAVVDGTTQLASAARLPAGRSGAALDAALRALLETAARGGGGGGGGGGRGPAPMAVGDDASASLSGADAVAAATDARVRALKERCSRAKASAAEFDGRCGFFASSPSSAAGRQGAVGAQREWWRSSSVMLAPPPPGYEEAQERKRREAEEAEAEAARRKEEADEAAAAAAAKAAGEDDEQQQQQQQKQQKQKKKKETAEDVDDEPPDVLDPLEPHTYTLPDGAAITVEPRLGAALGESLFRPRALAELLAAPAVASLGGGASGADAAAAAWGGGDGAGTLAEAVVSVAAQHPDPSVRRALLESMLPVGGVAVTPGLAGRLEAEVRARGAPLPSARAACPAPPPYWGARSRALRYAPWLGGAVLARVLPGQERLVQKGDYEEGGPAAVARKFLG
jgi:actin-related protein